MVQESVSKVVVNVEEEAGVGPGVLKHFFWEGSICITKAVSNIARKENCGCTSWMCQSAN